MKGMQASVLSSLSLSLLTFTLSQAERQTSICSLGFRREFLNGYILLDWKIHDFAITTDLKRDKHPQGDFLRLSLL